MDSLDKCIIMLETNGMKFDYEGFKEVISTKQKELECIKAEIFMKLGIRHVELDDVKEVVKALYKIGVFPESLAMEYLVQNKDNHPLYKLLLKYRNKKQFLVQYAKKLPTQICEDGRIRAKWTIDGAKTGRMTCSNPNLQAFPAITKQYFVAEKGYKFVIVDFSQIELRVLAEMSCDSNMINTFIESRDIHIETASAIFAKPIVNISEIERDVGKKVNFGICYGISAYGLQELLEKKAGLHVSLVQANYMRNRFYNRYPAILDYYNRLLMADEVFSLGGRGWKDINKGNRVRFNLPIQASAAEGLKEGLALLITQLKSQWKLVNVVHDEVILEVPEENVEEAKIVLEDCMIEGMKKLVKRVPIQVKAKVQDNWNK